MGLCIFIFPCKSKRTSRIGEVFIFALTLVLSALRKKDLAQTARVALLSIAHRTIIVEFEQKKNPLTIINTFR